VGQSLDLASQLVVLQRQDDRRQQISPPARGAPRVGRSLALLESQLVVLQRQANSRQQTSPPARGAAPWWVIPSQRGVDLASQLVVLQRQANSRQQISPPVRGAALGWVSQGPRKRDEHPAFTSLKATEHSILSVFTGHGCGV